MPAEISINGDGVPNALCDITNSSYDVTKDARTARRLKLLQKRKLTDLGEGEVTQQDGVNVQSLGATLPLSGRSKRRCLKKDVVGSTASNIKTTQLEECTAGMPIKIVSTENTISQATYCDSQVTFQPNVKQSNNRLKSDRATNIINSSVTSTAITVDSDSEGYSFIF